MCIWLEQQRHLVSSLPVIDQERLSQNSHIRANLLNRNSEFKFKCSYECEQERFQPTNYRLFINILCQIRGEAYSTRENRYPMHACGPPRNVSMLPHTPGMALAASLDDSQRSGLSQSRLISNFDQDAEYTYLNSRASFPHNASDRLIGRIGINTICPLRTLRSTNHSVMFNLHNKSMTIDRLTICYRKLSLYYQQMAFQVAQHHLSQLPSSSYRQAILHVRSPVPLSQGTTGNWAHPWLDYLTE